MLCDRKDHLVGKCFGLREVDQVPETSHIKSVKSLEDCRSICCNLGDKCVSWQVLFSSLSLCSFVIDVHFICTIL